MINFVTMGIFLKQSRKSLRITQESAAELANVSVETIRNIEHGNTIPNMATIFVLWDIYELPIEKIWVFYSRDPYTDMCFEMIKKKHKSRNKPRALQQKE